MEILEIENGRVVPNLNCHTIPELKAVMREYTDPIPALCYLYYRTTPNASYSHLPENEQELVLLQDFAGGYSLEDEVMIKAEEKLRLLSTTPTRKFFMNAKKGLEKLGDYLASAEITSGLHGNLSAVNSAMKSVGQTIEQFKKLEKIYEEESKSTIRGGHSKSFDE